MRWMKYLAVFAFVALTPFAVCAEMTYVFDDGFETGNTCRWSPTSCVPPPVNITIAWAAESAMSPVNGNEALANYEFDVTMQVSGADIYIERATQRDATPDGSSGVEYVLRNSSSLDYAGGLTASALVTNGSIVGDTPTHFKVPNGTTRLFRILVSLDNLGGTAGFYGLRLTGMSYDYDGAGAAADGGVIPFATNFGTGLVIFVDNQDHAN